MLDASARLNTLPIAAGVGFKPVHFTEIRQDPGPIGWIEIHAENYMGDGGRPHAQLRTLAEQFAVSVHGVGLSIGGADPLDTQHLSRLNKLIDWIKPASFSEHLAWSTHDGAYLNDLLPLPYTQQTLSRVASHIDQVQDQLACQMLLENPSSYLEFQDSTMSEPDFIAQLVERTGCGLLLDVNNVFVSASNLGFDPQSYIDAYPVESVHEIHVGGHSKDTDTHGDQLLIDTHGCAADEQVWDLLQYTLSKTGPQPVLVEWDADIPDWKILRAEADRAAHALTLV
ncbi:MAG: DUF692 domain-containing protein [Paracoccaceae bacterium]